MTNATISSLTSMNMGRLSSGESAEIPVAPGMRFEGGMRASEFSYLLVLHYEARLFFITKKFSKRWKVELRIYGDEFAWTTTAARQRWV
jgi:hypothetical protein